MLCIIQARLSSKRLPAKMFKRIINKTLIDRVIQQALKSKEIKKIVIATSKNKSDDLLFKYCQYKNINVYRGSLENVAERFYQISRDFKCDSFLRLNGDSPLIDPILIDYCIKKFQKYKCDILTNSFPKTFPKGQGIEIIKSKVFQQEFKNLRTKKDKEHVFPYFYRNKRKFNFKNVYCKQNLNSINLSLDTFKDLNRIRKILSNSNNITPSLNKMVKKNMKIYF